MQEVHLIICNQTDEIEAAYSSREECNKRVAHLNAMALEKEVQKHKIETENWNAKEKIRGIEHNALVNFGIRKGAIYVSQEYPFGAPTEGRYSYRRKTMPLIAI